jgi:serine/threonine protein kinase
VVTPAQPSRRSLGPGDKLGKYEVIRQIAVGAMAELYLTRTVGTEGFEKLVCVKRILPEHIGNPRFIGMFLNEARLAATLHHPNIAQVYDISQDDGEQFFSMEYVHGEDLGRLVASGRDNGVPISLDCTLTIAAGLCAGLHHAHDKSSRDGKPLGVVHRDVSPSNVLISYDGAVKLVDFGIARAGGEPSASQIGLKGKAAYLSPEQIHGRAPVDRRSDVFSVGTILYELTTGGLPFDDSTEYGILERIVNRDPDLPSALVPGYPPALEAIVMRALQRDPDRRFPTALALQNQLEDFAQDNRLRVSPLVLARLMSTLFPARLEEWDHARAQGAFFVEEHVVRTLIESGKTADSEPRAMPEPLPQFDEVSGGVATITVAGELSMEHPPWLPPAVDNGSALAVSAPAPSTTGWVPNASPSPRSGSPSAPSPSAPSPSAPSLSASASSLPRRSLPPVTRPPLVSRTSPPGGEPSSSSSPPSSSSSSSSSPSQLPSTMRSPARASSSPPPSGRTPRGLPTLSPPASLAASAAPASSVAPASSAAPARASSSHPVPPPASSHPAPQLSQLPSAIENPRRSLSGQAQGAPVARTTPSRTAVPALPGAVPIMSPFSAPPVPSGGTLVSSATQAGNPPPSVKPVSGPFDVPGLDGRARQSGHHVAMSRPGTSRDMPGGLVHGGPGRPGGAMQDRAGSPGAVTTRNAPSRVGPGATRPGTRNAPPRNGRDDETERVRGVAYPPAGRRRSRAPYVALGLLGVAGAAVGVWLATTGGNELITPETPRKTESADVAPRATNAAASEGPLTGAPTPAPAAAQANQEGTPITPGAQPRQAATRAAPSGSASDLAAPAVRPEPATPVAKPAAPAVVPPASAVQRTAKVTSSPVRPAQASPPRAARKDASLDPSKKKPAKLAPQEPRAKVVKPKVRVEPKRPAKSQPKEQPWSNDSPFMPETTLKR